MTFPFAEYVGGEPLCDIFLEMPARLAEHVALAEAECGG
jgi:hypothetical protein